MLVTKDFQIPLFHQVYQGNIPDRGLFPIIAKEIQEQHDNVLGKASDSTLVFDKGNIGQDAMERLIVSGQDFVCAIPKNTEMDAPLFNIPLEPMKQVPGFSGTRAYSCLVNLWGKKFKAVLAYSESFFTSQLTELTEHLQKCEKKLHDFDLAISRKNKGKQKRSAQSIKQSAQSIVNGENVKDFIEVAIKKQDGVSRLVYPADRDLPPLVLKAVDCDGRINIAAVIGELIRFPGQSRGLLAAARDSRAAFRTLDRCRRLLPGLFLGLGRDF